MWFQPKTCVNFFKLHYQRRNIKQKKRLSVSFSYASVFAAWTFPIVLFVSLSLFLYTLALSLSPPIPSLSTPHSPYSFLLLCLSGYDDWGFSCFLFVEFLCACVWLHANACACVCVCLTQHWAVSLSLPPGSKEPPSSRFVIGQGSGVLDTAHCWLLLDVFQQMVEVRECHHIGKRIRGERLSSRSCVVPTIRQLKILAPRYEPLYEQREIRWRNTRGKTQWNPTNSLL